MPPWLARLLGLGEPGLSESIATVLGRNQTNFTNEIHPSRHGGREAPVQLDPVKSTEFHQEPFVRDTLQRLVGGGVPVKQGFPGISLYPGHFGRPVEGSANPLTNSIRYSDPSVLSHEFGHILDYRNSAPELERAVASRFGEAEGYAGTNRTEHFASTFESALQFMRFWAAKDQRDFEDPETRSRFAEELQMYDEDIPGTREMILHLARHPLFEGKVNHLLMSVQPETRSSFLNFDLGPRP
jgi:hypothetical protein